MKAEELKRLFRMWKKSGCRVDDIDEGAKCYISNVSKKEYCWEGQAAFINFVRGYELGMMEKCNDRN
jgi:hypothetical protein